NLIVANSSNRGGGLYWCRGTIRNNTIVDNVAAYASGGAHNCLGHFYNNIVVGNSAPIDSDIDPRMDPTYCCLSQWANGGLGNLVLDPHFANADALDFHLRPDSPCIDSGK